MGKAEKVKTTREEEENETKEVRDERKGKEKKKRISIMSGTGDVTNLESERRRGEGRSVIVQIQHLDLKLANGFLGRAAVIFDRNRQPIEGALFVIQRDFRPDSSRRFINGERVRSVSVLT